MAPHARSEPPRLGGVRLAALLLAILPAAARGQGAPAESRYLTSPQTTSLSLPFSEAVRIGNVLYLSGMIGVVPGTMRLVPGGLEAETRQTMDNIRAVLERNGSSLDHVFRCTVMLADISSWGRLNAVYVSYFPRHLPARSAMGVTGLALGAQVEIQCDATIPAEGRAG